MLVAGRASGSGAVLEAPALVAGLDDVAMVGETVEQGHGHLGVAEHARPFAEGEIGRDDDRGLLVAAETPTIKLSSCILVTSNACGSSRRITRWQASW